MNSKLGRNQPTIKEGERASEEARRKVATESQNTVKSVKTSTMPAEREGSQAI